MITKMENELRLLKENQPELPELIRNRIDHTLAKLPELPTIVQRKNKKNKKGKWRLTAIAASLLIIFTSAAFYTIPAFAEAMRSLFSRGNVDIGLLNAQELGLIQNPHIKISDKGYTVKVNEAVVDPTRVIMALQLVNSQDQLDRNRLVFAKPNEIVIKDEQGRIIGSMYDQGMTSDFYYMVAYFPEPLKTDIVTIDAHIEQLGNEVQHIPNMHGDWSFHFTMDLKEAKKIRVSCR
ncbi:protein of unknown function [Paenibacillus sp. UNC496MF]|uniref:DUF4179 domain-containing protein n=1 Tax=Paenibacillus sp. UNC496MF TaxID=1502753 RepID=UPI0008EA8EAF|nr:DUF4179 domain-containing protein [Paenibacillus sp. UNC496MF]SFJ44675.1 protein of unknown function [Paenibacillus sp. UNC496MF]